MSGESLSIPGLLHVGMSGEHELAVLHVGPAVGWIALRGLHTWSREISVVLRSDVSDELAAELQVVLPAAQAEAARLGNAKRAASASPLVAVESPLVEKLQAKGVRVHTVGSDRITGGIYYFAKGGSGPAVRVEGNLVDMLAPAMGESADNAEIEAGLDGLIGRMLAVLSQGVLHEAAIELAAALPSLGEPESEGLAKLQTLEGYLVLAGTRASKYEERARSVVETVGQATRERKDSVTVSLFGEARRMTQAKLEIDYTDSESGEPKKLTLPERSRWFVPGLLKETIPPPAVAPKVDTDRIAAEKAAAEKAAAEKAAAEKAAAEKAAAEKAAAEKAAAEKAAAEKAAAEKAAAKKAAAEKAAAEKAAAEKAAAEKAAAKKAEPEKAAAKKGDAKKPESKKPAVKAPSERPKPAIEPESRLPGWVWLVLLLVAVAGTYYLAFFRHHH